MIRVLLVEDEAIVRKLIATTTDWPAFGCTLAAEAENGLQGLEYIQTLKPELVITDIRMPGMDGIKMLEQGKKYADFQSILLTGYSEFEYAHRAISLGSIDYILKPIDEDKLYAAIRKAVSLLLQQQEYQALREKGPCPRVEEDLQSITAACSDLYVRRVLRYMGQHYADHIGIEELADNMGISAGYLAKRFKAETGMNFGSALQRLRVQKAAALMESGTMRVYEIAEAVGYPNYKRFCEVFKQVTACTPTEYAALRSQLSGSPNPK